jgi:2-keto-4-pentenoate hydratase/2-oxohepta-3-ene-1,7-dioic acid hydratase in catechol pathway
MIGSAVYDAARLTGTASDETVTGILADWPNARRRLAAAAKAPVAAAVVAAPQLLAPVLYPGAIYCAGANYTDHVLEMAKAQNFAPDPDPHTLGLKAWHFMKPPRSIAGPDADVQLPPASSKVDWEAELAVVISRKATKVPLAEALDYIAGYTVANDLSARDLGTRQAIAVHSPFRLDWLAHKGFDGACPLGPWIVPGEDVADPQNLDIELSVNGVVKQKSNTSRMIFTVAEQISDLSHKCSLYPGDVILTGTPAGVGAGRNEFLKAGDRIDVRIQSIGELHTRVV